MEQQTYEPIRFDFRHHNYRFGSKHNTSFSSEDYSRRLRRQLTN